MIRLQDIMSTNVRTVAPSMDTVTASSLMAQHDIHHLVVMDGSEIVGVVSARDLGREKNGGRRSGGAVCDVMTVKPVTAKPADTLRQAANKLRGRGIGCLPVVDGGKLRGIVTIADCLELIGHGSTGKANRRPLTHKQGRQHTQFKKR